MQSARRSVPLYELDAVASKIYSGDAQKVRDHVRSLLQDYPSFVISEEKIPSNWTDESFLVLTGSVPGYYSGSTYQIPVEIGLKDYPRYGPSCYVIPTEELEVKKKHKSVHEDGKCELMYLTWWRSDQCSLKELADLLVSTFKAEYPLFAKAGHQKKSSEFDFDSNKSPSATSSGLKSEHLSVSQQERKQGALYVKSAGHSFGDYAEIRVHGIHVDMSGRGSSSNRGFHIVVLDYIGNVQNTYVFDTCGGFLESDLLSKVIDDLEVGRVVIAAVKGDGASQLGESAKLALESIGGASIRKLEKNGSYAIIGVKGYNTNTKYHVEEWIENHGATCSITTTFENVAGPTVSFFNPFDLPASTFQSNEHTTSSPSANPFMVPTTDSILTEDETCVVCLESKRTSAFIPCGHKCICDKCASDVYNQHIKTCPLCRQLSTNVIKIY